MNAPRLYKIGTKVRIVKVDPPVPGQYDPIWQVGDTGVITEHDIRVSAHMQVDYRIKMDRQRGGLVNAFADHDYVVPITKPPLLERIRRRFIKPSIDLTPGFKWEDMDWHPKDFIPDEEKETVND